MKKASQNKLSAKREIGLRPEYRFGYTTAKPNRFAARSQSGSVAILLDADVALVFKSAESVNAVLRALAATMPARRTSRKTVTSAPRRPSHASSALT
jgi:hypothetical protein